MGEVLLLIRKVPENTGVEAVKKFVKSGASLRYRFFVKITKVSTITVVNSETMEAELQCVVALETGDDLDKMIKRLHAKHLNGRRVFVKRYHQRNFMNDRRKGPGGAPPSEDGRVDDRRKNKLLLFGGAKSNPSNNKPSASDG